MRKYWLQLLGNFVLWFVYNYTGLDMFACDKMCLFVSILGSNISSAEINNNVYFSTDYKESFENVKYLMNTKSDIRALKIAWMKLIPVSRRLFCTYPIMHLDRKHTGTSTQ